MTHHPHVHMIVPGGGISLDGRRWISSRPAFLLPVRVLGALFRRLFLTQLIELHEAGKLVFFGAQADLADPRRFLRHLAPVRKKRWVVYAKAPFAGPEAVLAYLSRYTHRVAISNSRLIAYDETGVTFRYKDYRRDGPERQRVMTLAPHEFIRRFLLHVLPQGFHRIRHYGLLASSARKANIARAREMLAVAPPRQPVEAPEPLDWLPPCPCCGGRMRIIETFERWMQPRAPPRAAPGSSNRDAVVTRHGQRSPRAATPLVPATAICTPFARIVTKDLNLASGQLQIQANAGRKISLAASPPPPSPTRRRHHRARAKPEIPIDRCRSPAGSCLGGFRTPNGIRKPSPTQP